MSDHETFVALAYAAAFLTIGGVAARIVLEYRWLKAELARFSDKGRREDDRNNSGGAA